jgi:hypothetical protein
MGWGPKAWLVQCRHDFDFFYPVIMTSLPTKEGKKERGKGEGKRKRKKREQRREGGRALSNRPSPPSPLRLQLQLLLTAAPSPPHLRRRRRRAAAGEEKRRRLLPRTSRRTTLQRPRDTPPTKSPTSEDPVTPLRIAAGGRRRRSRRPAYRPNHPLPHAPLERRLRPQPAVLTTSPAPRDVVWTTATPAGVHRRRDRARAARPENSTKQATQVRP